MNTLLKICLPVFIVLQSFAQNTALQSRKWILLDSRIEKNDIHLAAYSPGKLKTDSFVMRFLKEGKIDYDYETNVYTKSGRRTEFLDIDMRVSGWVYNDSLKILTLTLKGGYATLDDFSFIRNYKIELNNGGCVLRLVSEQSVDNISNSVPTRPEVTKLLVKETSDNPIANAGGPIANEGPELIKESFADKTEAKLLANKAISKAMLIASKRWILIGNKITKNIIRFTSYDVSKFRINTMVLNFAPNGKIEYDYESDPEIEFCAGIEFLDIDTDESTWVFDEKNNLLTLTIKGGFSSLDDFKFKRDYKIELIDDEYVLRKSKEHYFIDFRKQNKRK